MVAAIAGTLCGCATVPARALPAPVQNVEDSALFVATARQLQAVMPGSWSVDPHPAIVDVSESQWDPRVIAANTSADSVVDESTLARRERILAILHIPVANMATWMRCPGALVPPMPGIVAQKRQFCPTVSTMVVLIGRPRLPETGTGATLDDARGNVRYMRVLIASIGPQGSSETTYDYVFALRVERWEWVRTIPLIITD